MWRVAVLVVVCVVATGCGGGEGPARQEYVAAVEGELVELAGERVRESARCVGDAAVDAVGLEQLHEEDVEPAWFGDDGLESDDLDIDEDHLVEAVEECDYAFFVASEATRQSASAVSDESRECIADNLRREPRFVPVAVDDLRGRDIAEAAEGLMTAALVACPDAVAQAIVAILAADSAELDIRPGELVCMNDLVRADAPRAAALLLGKDDAAAEAWGVELGLACAGAG